MQFKVPQFLEIEDKIFGPFTFRQFVYLTGGAGMCFLLYRLLGLWVSAIPIVAIAGFALALAFYKPNNKPFIFMVQAVFKYFLQGRMYIWKNPKNGILIKNQVQAGLGIGNQNISYPAVSEGRLSGNKLRDLAWSLDVLDLNKEK